MASSIRRQKQQSLTPRDYHSHACIIQEMKTSISKVTITTGTPHNQRPISKGNHIALEQKVVNKIKKATINKQTLVVEEKHKVRETKIVSSYTAAEKEKKRTPHKHRSGGTLEVTIKTKS